MDAPAVGTVLDGRYRLERLLGRGGMGSVFAARHVQIDEPVAVKVLHRSLAREPDLVTRFQREAKAARKIQSEHAVKILDVGVADGAPYLVMEQLDGMDLEQLLEQGPLPVLTAVDCVLQAMEALAEAHMQGVVHRDLKPANLFLTRRPDGTSLVKVLDFGISKVTNMDGDLSLTKPGAGPMGSPLYMAPEQLRSSRAVDARVDIWALGAILYELLAGTTPFNGTTMTELCAAVLQDPVPSLHARRIEVPPQIDAIVGRCLAKDPAARYPDVGALAFDLASFAPNRGSVNRIAGIFRESSTTAPTAMAPPIVPMAPLHSTPRPTQEPPLAMAPAPPVVPARVRANRGSKVALVGVLLVVGVVIGGAGFFLRSRSLRTDTPQFPTALPDLIRSGSTEAVPVLPMSPVAFRPLPGSYAGPVDVVMTSSTPAVWIHYTITGADPTEASPLYMHPIHLAGGGLLKARAFGPGHAPSEPTVAAYSAPVATKGFDLETPVVVDLGSAPCGTAITSTEIPIKNDGHAASFRAALRKGEASPFVIAEASRGPTPIAAGETKRVVISAPSIPRTPASLSDVSDILEITVGDLPARSISVHAKGIGAVLADRIHELDAGDMIVGQKWSRALFFHNAGTATLDLSLSSTDESVFAASTMRLTVEPDRIAVVSMAFAPKAVGPAAGAVSITPNPSLPYCDAPPPPISLRGNGVK